MTVWEETRANSHVAAVRSEVGRRNMVVRLAVQE